MKTSAFIVMVHGFFMAFVLSLTEYTINSWQWWTIAVVIAAIAGLYGALVKGEDNDKNT